MKTVRNRTLVLVGLLTIFAVPVCIAQSRITTLDGRPLAGPNNSDCQWYQYVTGMTAINCPLQFYPVTNANGPHTIQTSEWGGVLVASGGGTVDFVLPPSARVGRNIIGFATDGNTGFTITAQSPNVMQGSSSIVNGVITMPPNSNGAAGLSGNIWQIDMR